MLTPIDAIRTLHITAGFLAFVVAPVAMLTVKGGRPHRRAGKIYFWAMAAVAATAIPLAIWRPVIWLALTAVFSFYAAFSGYRALYRKRPYAGEAATPVDWAAATVTAVASATLFALGVVPPDDAWARSATIAVVFGLVGVGIAGQDLVKFARPSRDPRAWWFSHMTGMLASYVATVSAFSSVNFTFLPRTVRFLWPVVVGVPAITIWVRFYRARFARTPAVASAG